MKRRYWMIGIVAAAAGTIVWGAAQAQVPPHQPGTVCYTPRFWCWAQPPGPPGTQCACRTPQGWVSGYRG